MTDLQKVTDLDDRSLSKAFAQSGFFKDSRDASKAIVKIIGGRELGIGPMTAMKEIHLVEGKMEMSASLMARLVKESDKYDYFIDEHTNQRCSITFMQKVNGEMKEIGTSEFTIQDALDAGLVDEVDNGEVKARSRKGNPLPWEKYTRNMLFARAISNGVKWYTPDVTGGSVYHEGEISDSPDISEVSGGGEEPDEVVDADFDSDQKGSADQSGNADEKPDVSGDEDGNGEGPNPSSDTDTAGNGDTGDDEDGSGDNGDDRPEWADEWLDRDLETIKSAYDGGDVTAEEVASRERQLPEDEQRQEVLAWASTEVDKKQADELNEPQPLG